MLMPSLARRRARLARDQRIHALVVEAEPVDDRALLGQAEHARPRITRLRPRRNRADLDEAEAHAVEGFDALAVLVEPGGEADAIAEFQAHQLHRILDRAPGEQTTEARVA